ncbi:hypothetical protein K438DRAFT_1946823 [Mycena galopus ATCC 62051]|nr:hypothetical protein K438DRAFT_1946823 [Mycena galopus ATCC 62051]
MQGITILPANLDSCPRKLSLRTVGASLHFDRLLFVNATNPRWRNRQTPLDFSGLSCTDSSFSSRNSVLWYIKLYLPSSTSATPTARTPSTPISSSQVKSPRSFVFPSQSYLVTYRLWIIRGRNMKVVIFPIVALFGLGVASIGLNGEVLTWKSRLRGAPFDSESGPWEAAGSMLSLFCWLIISAMTTTFESDAAVITADNFLVILGVSNTLIHSRVGLEWSGDSIDAQKQKWTEKSSENAVWGPFTHILEYGLSRSLLDPAGTLQQ